MHDPSVQVFEIHVPIPVKRWKSLSLSNGLRRRTWTGDGPKAGTPMRHFLRPEGWELVIAGRRMGWWKVLEVWHEEPQGHDSGSVCKGQKGSQLTWHNVKWAWAHRAHLRIYSPPWRRVVFWRKGRCAGCGLPFRWNRDARHALGWDSSDVYHGPCASLVHVRRQLKDAYAVLAFDADDNAQWRVGRALEARKGRIDGDDT